MVFSHTGLRQSRLYKYLNIGEMMRFGFVGVLNILISFVFFYLTYNYWPIASSFSNFSLETLRAAGLTLRIDEIQTVNAAFANIIAYIAGMINSFVLNKTWTFQVKDGTLRQLLRFVAINLVALLLSTSAIFLLIDVLGGPYIATWFVVIAPVTVLSYLANKFWAFSSTTDALTTTESTP